jgi:hypothetical protein
MTPKAGLRPKAKKARAATKRSCRKKVGKDGDPSRMKEDKRSFFQSAWGGKAKGEANGKAKAKEKPKAKTKEKA